MVQAQAAKAGHSSRFALSAGLYMKSFRATDGPRMMTQTAAILTRNGSIQLELPPAQLSVMDGVAWGAVDAFPTPAYWVYQVMYRRLVGTPPQYRLGRTLAEEVGACLLGGHGIPASVGIAAYQRLRTLGMFAHSSVSEDELARALEEPLKVGERTIRYRFAAQKAKYLAAVLPALSRAPSTRNGRELRDWLKQLPGIGPKTASWIARNWMDADDVAILDIHIMRVGRAIGLFPAGMSVERHYGELEQLFLEFSALIEVRPSELDAVIWHEMATSPRTVQHLVAFLDTKMAAAEKQKPRRREPATALLSFV